MSIKTEIIDISAHVCRFLAVLSTCALAACTSAPRIERIAVPVPCHASIPPRPAMPTEALVPGAALDVFAAAAIAEIERREGYEGELRAALTACVGEVTGGAR